MLNASPQTNAAATQNSAPRGLIFQERLSAWTTAQGDA